MCNYFYLFYLFITTVTSYTVTNKIDFERDCNTQLMVYDSTIAEIFARPQSGVQPDISNCQAKFVAQPTGRKLKIYIHEFNLGGGACGHKLKIYDGDPNQNEPKWVLGCNTKNQEVYTSATNEVIISFVKPSVDTSQIYKFNLKVTTDKDEPYLLFRALKMPAYRIIQHRQRRESENIPSYTAPLTGSAGGSSGGGLTSGAIAGIAVGCVVGAVIIIAICIYALWKLMRNSEEKKRYGQREPPPVFVTPTSSNVNGILKHPGSAGSTRSKSTKSRGVDNDAFSDISETRTSKFNGNPGGDYDNRYENRGSYSRRSGDRLKHDNGHQNPGFYDDDNYNRTDKYDDRRQSYKMANEEKGHISLADLSRNGGAYGDGDHPLQRRQYGDESRTESSFNTETTTSRTYSDSSQEGDHSVSMNPKGRFKRNAREGSIRTSRNRTQSLSSSKSGASRRPRSSSLDAAEQTSQQASQKSSHHGHKQHHDHHNQHRSHHGGSSRRSRRKQQRPPDPYLPIFDETKQKMKKPKY